MSTNFITTDTVALKTYHGIGTKREVLINTHEDKFVLLKIPTATEWNELGHQFATHVLERSIQAYEIYDQDKKLLRIFSYDPQNKSAFDYLQTDWLKSKITNQLGWTPTSYKDIVRYLHTLNETEQFEFWKSIRPISRLDFDNSMRFRFFKEKEIDSLNIEELTRNYEFSEGINYLVNLLACPSFGRKGLCFSDHDKHFVKSTGYKQKVLEFLVFLKCKDYLLFSIGAYLKLLSLNQLKNGGGTNTGRLIPIIRDLNIVNNDVKKLMLSISDAENVELH